MTKDTFEIKPKAVTSNIVVQQLGDELLVYNLLTNKAMSLNPTIAAIWQSCDGNKKISEIGKIVAKALNSTVSDDLIFLGLDKLRNHSLLENRDLKGLSPINRRELVRKIGLTTALALPFVISVVAPQANHAASGNTCSQNSDCPSNCCVTNTCTQFNAGGNAVGNPCFVDTDCQSNCCDTNICAPACDVCFI